VFGVSIFSCGQNPEQEEINSGTTAMGEQVFYEIFVHAFYDSNGDGIGDLNGVTAKLDYLEELGVNALWLLPVHPSPSYHKYDVTDYYSIHPDYGTMDDLKILLAEAHKRNIIVLLDMVINHTSDQHPFFMESRKGKENPFRDYYVWSSDTLLQKENPWHWHKNPGDDQKYYGFFWKGMPDLNFDKPEVREEMKKIGAFWLSEVGVDGFRLDAIKYTYPDSLLDKNVEWWQEYRASLEETGEDFFLVAEIWDSSAFIGPFLNKGVHSAFNFDLSFAIEEMLHDGRDPGLAFLLEKTHKHYQEDSEDYQDAIFIKNHDQDRIMSLLSDPRQAKLAASILLTLPGVPFLYYGEEIGMKGKKPDEYIREPMVWDLPGLDQGQTRWIEPLYSTPENVDPVSVQIHDPESLFMHYKKLIAIRKENSTLACGTIKPLENISDKLCTYMIGGPKGDILVVHNLTDIPQTLDNKLLHASGPVLHFKGIDTPEKGGRTLAPFNTLIQYMK
jgi:glycosidase